MALVLDATPGGASANSYSTRAEADAYHESRLHSSVWTAADPVTKDTALVMATRLLDAMYNWRLYATTSSQSLAWPRSGMLAANERDYVPNDQVPPELKEATAEFARQLISEDTSANNEIAAKGLTSLRAGPVAFTFDQAYVQTKTVPDAVVNLMPPWWGSVRGRGGMMRELKRA